VTGGRGIPARGAWVGETVPANGSAPGTAAPSAPTGAAEARSPRKSGELPARLPVLPLAQVVVFPHVVAPLVIDSERVIEAVDRAVESHKRVLLGIVKLASGSDHPPGVLADVPVESLADVATLGTVVRLLKIGDGTLRMLVQGNARVRLAEVTAGPEGLSAAFTPIAESVSDPLRTEALRRQVTGKMLRIIELAPQLAGEMREVLEGITDPGKLTDFCAANLSIDTAAKAQLLGTGDVTARIEKLATLLDQEIQVLEVGSQISEKLKSRLDEHQREYVLREQLKLIREELGEEEGGEDDADGLRTKLEAAHPPEEALKAGRRELGRLGRMSPQSAEYQVARTYVEVLASLPWAARSDDRLDVANARAILDRDHFDLEKVKDRIIEYLAVHQLNPTVRGSILCFVGPPGVG
jgi:ATP-dependent Lon protease